MNIERYKRRSDTKEEKVSELDFGDTPKKLKEEYLDIYGGIQLEILSITRFDENSDLSTTYLRRVDMTRASKIKAAEAFSISEQGYTVGRLLDGSECQILLNTGTRKSFMSKSHYLWCKSLHLLSKSTPKTQRIHVGNGQFISVLFLIPIIVDIHRHIFKIYTLVSEIHKNVNLVLGIKNIFELEGVINSWDCCFNFLTRSTSIFPKECIALKPKEQSLIKVDTPFLDKISGLAIMKVLDKSSQSTMMLKLKFTWDLATLDITNSGLDTIIFDPNEMLGILDLRSLGYYKIKQGILQQNLSKYYRF